MNTAEMESVALILAVAAGLWLLLAILAARMGARLAAALASYVAIPFWVVSLVFGVGSMLVSGGS